MNILLYGNGSSGNHGCEAITRGTVDLLGNQFKYLIMAEDTDQDYEYGLNELADIYPAKTVPKKDLAFMKAYLQLKLKNNYYPLDFLAYKEQIDKLSAKIDLALSVGGDNYCYGNTVKYAMFNFRLKKQNIKTVLWGCSIEPAVIRQKAVQQDLRRYDLIVARESITYEALKDVAENVVLSPDPAFYMVPEACDLPSAFMSSKVVGINLSPMIVSNESKDGITFQNYETLIKYILHNTDYSIALIPHVVWKSNNDLSALRELAAKFGETDRLIMIEDHNARELKYIISNCDLFVGARTHATIAAYSTAVPTLVVGYSVKAAGIARDLFGSQNNFTLPVQKMRDKDELLKMFIELEKDKDRIRNHLKHFLPEYLSSGNRARLALLQVAGLEK